MQSGGLKQGLRNRHFFMLDVIAFMGIGIFSFAIRLETFNIPQFINGLTWFLIIAIPIKMAIFFRLGAYNRYWKTAGASELLLIWSTCLIAGTTIILICYTLAVLIPSISTTIPRSIPVIDFCLTLIAMITLRFSPRAEQHLRRNRQQRQRSGQEDQKRVLIIGAGQTGSQIADALSIAKSAVMAFGFLDDDAQKVGTIVRGLKVLGRLQDLPFVVQPNDIQLVVIAIPSAPGKVIREIVQVCQKIGVEYKIAPGMYELVTGQITVNMLRAISIDDLLRREPVHFELDDIRHALRGNCILVTGAGGSIGSELSRQIATFKPSKLLLLGHGENSLFEIHNKLRNEYPDVSYETLLVDIQDKPRMEAIFAKWQPRIVFHAAAHKHVPMLECNVSAAIANNIKGTRNLIDLCNQYNIERMIVISTDKAVHPSSVMGMTKRVVELLMIQAAQEHPGRFAAVRFGNVLGSRGSVVPIFQQQIAMGGPITVTSAEMTRFFMSIPEAVLLVLKASALTQQASLFVLNMGEPVPILSLAQDLIRLNGLDPDHDIEIKISGLRSGEKLTESLFWDYEAYQPVEKGAIFALELSSDEANRISGNIHEQVDNLVSATLDKDDKEMKAMLSHIVFAASKAESKVVATTDKVSTPMPMNSFAPLVPQS